MVQKKLPLINSAHGSETRNIINELIKLFNNMGYTYNESLQKAQDILEEAKQTNDMNESVQQQINTLIAESGTSDAEVVQARIDSEGNEYDVLKTRLDEKEQNFSTQLAHNANNVNSQLIKMLNDGEVTKIKLIGDSITAGVGAYPYYEEQNRQIIYRNGAWVYETGSDWNGFPSWANRFRKFINTSYPNVDFFNAGVGGLRAEEVRYTFLTDLISENEDVIFVMLGMNDRPSRSINQYRADMEYILDYISQRSNLMIVMTPSPATTDFTDDNYTEYQYNFGVREIDAVLTDICSKNLYPHISHYRGILENATKEYGSKLTDYIQSNGSHPVNRGHKIMWRTIQQQLGFVNDINEWFDEYWLPTADISQMLPSFPPTAFPYGESYTRISLQMVTDNPDVFPENKAGVLKTTKTSRNDGDAYLHQTYSIYSNGKELTRGYNGSEWLDWIDYSNGRLQFTYNYEATSSSKISFFENNRISYTNISPNVEDRLNFPETDGGILITTKLFNDVYGFQEFNSLRTGNVYKRGILSNGNWNNWVPSM